jgi:hypothetical protein
MRAAVAAGRHFVVTRVFDRLPELGLTPAEVRDALETALQEVTLNDCKPPDDPYDPPGHGFVWYSKQFNCRMYLKFRLEGKKPVCVLYSFHRAEH